MAFTGVILMIQGFGSLIANHFFGGNFGLLHLVLDGTALTVAGAVVGVAGLLLTIGAVAKDS
ncbi:hypothetical protein ACIBQ1_46565 [Nonomuraea sp. NPDC050153]|uniref:hypothetical protein n=1 Tax=Nonomuraea sp. NPDC050153 TaxID=3364359 RepID=UPI0037938186